MTHSCSQIRMGVSLRNVALCALLLSTLTFVSRAEPAPTPTQEQQRAEDDLRQLNAEEVRGFLEKDPKKEEAIWSDDFVVTNPLNKFVTKKQVLEMMASGFLVLTSCDRQIDYLRVYGDTAVIAGTEKVLWGGRMPRAGKTDLLRFTGIWRKQDGRWQEIARHANIVPAGG